MGAEILINTVNIQNSIERYRGSDARCGTVVGFAELCTKELADAIVLFAAVQYLVKVSHFRFGTNIAASAGTENKDVRKCF
mmetsp:Transcript_12529/g.20447  ORF Transcript_12529/g.20447 Transcript_12529/m.20447 type:complete len:81 (+) Transcript_12529:951-1193(+)